MQARWDSGSTCCPYWTTLARRAGYWTWSASLKSIVSWESTHLSTSPIWRKAQRSCSKSVTTTYSSWYIFTWSDAFGSSWSRKPTKSGRPMMRLLLCRGSLRMISMTALTTSGCVMSKATSRYSATWSVFTILFSASVVTRWDPKSFLSWFSWWQWTWWALSIRLISSVR